MDSATRRIGELLAPLTNWERTRPDRPRFTLDTIRQLVSRLDPALLKPAPRAVQVGGSKGKGSTCAWIASLAGQASLRVGTYASPHVESIRERITLPDGLCPETTLVAAVERCLAEIAGLDPAPSAFEVLTAAAACCFADARLDLAVWEVGLGGRLDATSAMAVDVTVLTGVELEHTAILGDTIAAIAAEKVAIFRPGGLAVSGCVGSAAAVAREHARRVGCRLLERGIDFQVDAGPPGAEGARRIVLSDLDGCRDELVLADAPAWQIDSLALAWAATRRLVTGWRPPSTLRAPELPGRFERRFDHDGQLVVLDGAHTEESVARLYTELVTRWPGQRFAVLFAAARGKRWQAILSRIAPIADEIVVTELADTPSEDAATIRDWLLSSGIRARAVPGVVDALATLREFASPRVVTGSFHLVGEIRGRLPHSAAPDE